MGVVISPLLKRLDKKGLENLKVWLACLQDAGIEVVQDTACPHELGGITATESVVSAMEGMMKLGIVSVSSASKLLCDLPEDAMSPKSRSAGPHPPAYNHLPLTSLLISTTPASSLRFLPMILDCGHCKLSQAYLADT